VKKKDTLRGRIVPREWLHRKAMPVSRPRERPEAET
jgi:hypothetical protein